MQSNYVKWYPWHEAPDQIRSSRPRAPRLGEHRLKAETFDANTQILYWFENNSAIPIKFALVTHPETIDATFREINHA